MERTHYFSAIKNAFQVFPAVALLGPRQAGKSTLARQWAQRCASDTFPVHFFDLEDPTQNARFNDPHLVLDHLRGLAIIDEIQLRPDLFPLLRVLIDRPNHPLKFLILGSASRDLIQQSSETLAGRLALIELMPFSLSEVSDSNHLWIRGGFPRAYLSNTDTDAALWRENYIRTYLERDIPMLGIRIPPIQLRRFWMMLAHYHGQIFNASEIAGSLGISDKTAKSYLSILAETFMIRILSPWFENIGKRQIKSPKVYFRDSGIFHSLIGVQTREGLETHPKLGASWEGFALEQVIGSLRALPSEVFFWGIHNQGELDLLVTRDGKRIGYEVKYTSQPRQTDSICKAIDLLNLDEVRIIVPGNEHYPLSKKTHVWGLERLKPTDNT